MNQDWELKTLGDVCKISWGNVDLTKKSYVYDGEYLAVSAAGCDGRIDFKEHNKFTPTLSAIGARCGRMFFPTEDFTAIKNTITFTPDKTKVFDKFLYYLLTYSELPKRGAAQPFISKRDLENFKSFFPLTLEKQKQIVSKIDQAFSAIDTAKLNVEKNLKNAKELFQSKLTEIFSQKGENWTEKSLVDICDEIFAGGDAPKDNYSKDKTQQYTIPIYANAVKNNGLYGYTNLSRVSKPSVTIAARGSGTGHTEIRIEPFYPIVRLIVLVPNDEVINLYLLKYSIQTLDILSSGSAIPQLTVPMIKEYLIPVPPLSQQVNVVQLLDTLKEQTQSLESKYQQELNSLEELKKSILEKAFAGEL